MHYFSVFIYFCFVFISNLCAQAGEANRFSEAQTSYYENNINKAISILQNIVEEKPDDIKALNWLAQCYIRLYDNSKAETYSQKVLEIDPDNAFAHLVYGKSILPHYLEDDISLTDPSWQHYLKAAESDPTNPNIWVEIWGESIRRQDPEMFRKSLQGLSNSGFLTTAVLSYGRWMLRTLPENALLITNGDMDTYPVQVLQEVEGFRTDVTIIERGLLELNWSVKFLKKYYQLPVPYSDEKIDLLAQDFENKNNESTLADTLLAGWIDKIKKKSFSRPLAFAPTVNPQFYSKYIDLISNAGSFLLVSPIPVENTNNMKLIKAGLDGIKQDDFSGPWVSDSDLSPIRTIYTKRIVRNIVYSGLVYSDELIKSEKINEALKTLNWLEKFETLTELGPSYTKEIIELKHKCSK